MLAIVFFSLRVLLKKKKKKEIFKVFHITMTFLGVSSQSPLD